MGVRNGCDTAYKKPLYLSYLLTQGLCSLMYPQVPKFFYRVSVINPSRLFLPPFLVEYGIAKDLEYQIDFETAELTDLYYLILRLIKLL